MSLPPPTLVAGELDRRRRPAVMEVVADEGVVQDDRR
jgi:hypothetical protein